MDYFRDFKQAAGVVFSRKQYDQAISGHSHRWRLHVYIRQYFTASLFKIGDWLAGHLKEVGHKAVYKVKLLQLLPNFCIISAILNVSMKRKKIKFGRWKTRKSIREVGTTCSRLDNTNGEKDLFRELFSFLASLQ